MLVIIDYGIGNVRSVSNALNYLNIPCMVSRDHAELRSADALLLPGVGAFGEGVRRIEEYNIAPALHEACRDEKPILGICLGFELLMKDSLEMGTHIGLGFLDQTVEKIPVTEKLPHIGWSKVRTPSRSPRASRLMHGLEDESFYFVHSYGVAGGLTDEISAEAQYGNASLMVVVEKDNVFGTQFHPEKSGEAGLEMLLNFSRTY